MSAPDVTACVLCGTGKALLRALFWSLLTAILLPGLAYAAADSEALDLTGHWVG